MTPLPLRWILYKDIYLTISYLLSTSFLLFCISLVLVWAMYLERNQWKVLMKAYYGHQKARRLYYVWIMLLAIFIFLPTPKDLAFHYHLACKILG